MRDAAHRRQHCCAIFEDLACSGFNLHLAAYCSWVERWDDGGESCAVLLCWAVLCYRSCYLCTLPPRSPKTLFFIARKCSRILHTNTKICTRSKKCRSDLFWGKPYITLVVTSKIKPYRVYVVWEYYERKADILRNSYTL